MLELIILWVGDKVAGKIVGDAGRDWVFQILRLVRRLRPYPQTRTILFTDMFGSTEQTQRLGDVKAVEILGYHDRIVDGALRKHAGIRIKHTGDGVLADFASANSGVSAAVAIQRGVAAHNILRPESRFQVRVGLNSGEPIQQGGDLFGSAVNLASRVCGHAQADQIVCSGVVRGLCQGKGLTFVGLGAHNLKGFAEPVDLFEVPWQPLAGPEPELAPLAPQPADQPAPEHAAAVDFSRLPETGALLFGRESQLDALEGHWRNRTRLLAIVAEGGIGKTALVSGWLDRLAQRGYDDARVFAWSTYLQGTGEQASADAFFAAALRWFGHEGPIPPMPVERGQLLARLVRSTRTLLVIDGLEPLQYEPGVSDGRLRDLAMEVLLRDLAAENSGLCLITSRQPLSDLAGCIQISLPHLEPEVGACLLASFNVNGTVGERAGVSQKFDGHALALTLLGTWLRDARDGRLEYHLEIQLMKADATMGGHAARVMLAYEKRLRPAHLAVLELVSLFDRPASPELISVVRQANALPDLPIDEDFWAYTLDELRRARLLAADPGRTGVLDTHPLVCAHFAERFRQRDPEAWRRAHARLYEHLRDTTQPEFPDTLAGLEPLYQALAHGCKAGLHQQTLEEVYWPRIRREGKHFSTKVLGAFGVELAALAGFFDPQWTTPVAGVIWDDRAWLLNEAGFTLRAVGRLDEAVAAFSACLDMRVEQADWPEAAITAGNLCETHLLRGAVTDAVATARRGVAFADRSDDGFQQLALRTNLADALAQAGDAAGAEEEFAEAERRQAERDPRSPRLHSLQGFQYCDLLLDRGAVMEVRERAAAALAVARSEGWALDIALDTLSLGRAEALAVRQGGGDATLAAELLGQAVAALRQSGQQDEEVRGFLARAGFRRERGDLKGARCDLDEARRIAERGGMRLYLADIALEDARIALAAGHRADARTHLQTAQGLIAETGYHRRDRDAREIAEQLAAVPA